MKYISLFFLSHLLKNMFLYWWHCPFNIKLFYKCKYSNWGVVPLLLCLGCLLTLRWAHSHTVILCFSYFWSFAFHWSSIPSSCPRVPFPNCGPEGSKERQTENRLVPGDVSSARDAVSAGQICPKEEAQGQWPPTLVPVCTLSSATHTPSQGKAKSGQATGLNESGRHQALTYAWEKVLNSPFFQLSGSCWRQGSRLSWWGSRLLEERPGLWGNATSQGPGHSMVPVGDGMAQHHKTVHAQSD